MHVTAHYMMDCVWKHKTTCAQVNLAQHCRYNFIMRRKTEQKAKKRLNAQLHSVKEAAILNSALVWEKHQQPSGGFRHFPTWNSDFSVCVCVCVRQDDGLDQTRHWKDGSTSRDQCSPKAWSQPEDGGGSTSERCCQIYVITSVSTSQIYLFVKLLLKKCDLTLSLFFWPAEAPPPEPSPAPEPAGSADKWGVSLCFPVRTSETVFKNVSFTVCFERFNGSKG